jgi:hypothetical protein
MPSSEASMPRPKSVFYRDVHPLYRATEPASALETQDCKEASGYPRNCCWQGGRSSGPFAGLLVRHAPAFLCDQPNKLACFIVFLFWNCNLHYMNVLFAVFGYRIFTINPPDDRNPLSGRESVVLITRRTTIFPGDRITPYRLSNSVYWEVD